MPVPLLQFDDPDRGLPRRLVPLRLAYLITGLNFSEFYHYFLSGTLTRDGEPILPIYEIDRDGQPRTVQIEDYAETLPRDTGTARLTAELPATLPKNHFVCSDEVVFAVNAAVSAATGARVSVTDMDWNPALHGMDAFIAECPDIRRMLAASTSPAELSPRELRKQDTAALHARWQQAYKDLKAQHPDKSDAWIANKIERMPIAEGRSAETIRRNMKRK